MSDYSNQEELWLGAEAQAQEGLSAARQRLSELNNLKTTSLPPAWVTDELIGRIQAQMDTLVYAMAGSIRQSMEEATEHLSRLIHSTFDEQARLGSTYDKP